MNMKDSANVADLVSKERRSTTIYPCQEVRDLRELLSAEGG